MIIADGAAKRHRGNVLEYTQCGTEATLRIPKCSLYLSCLFSV